MARGPLAPNVTINAGDDYRIASTGTVSKGEAEDDVVDTFHVGTGAWPFETVGHGLDRANLFALPWPYFPH